MAEPKTRRRQAANTAVKNEGDHDRVVMLSLNADGTPDQHNPEIIGDKDAAIAAAKVQFAQQAVSAVDAEKRAELGLAGTDEGDTSDAKIDALKAEHDKVAAAAEKRAESVVNVPAQGLNTLPGSAYSFPIRVQQLMAPHEQIAFA
jgi:hypothetical protein